MFFKIAHSTQIFIFFSFITNKPYAPILLLLLRTFLLENLTMLIWILFYLMLFLDTK